MRNMTNVVSILYSENNILDKCDAVREAANQFVEEKLPKVLEEVCQSSLKESGIHKTVLVLQRFLRKPFVESIVR